MVDTPKIKGRMAELGITQADLAKNLGIAAATTCQKINNVRSFTLEESEVVSRVLKISDRDFKTYFFAHRIASRNKDNDKAVASCNF